MRRLLLVLSLTFSSLFLNAQNITVSGVVTDKATGETLIGVNVIVKNSSKGDVTDFDGKYSISSVPKGSILVFSYLGYKTLEVTADKDEVNVALEESAEKLDEIVVVGYGTQRITNVSGAISTVKNESIEQLKPVRAEEALQTQASGINVITSGSPGAAPAISIRGVVSNSGSSPLIVIDGLQATVADLNAINPSDIESINVLKDAALTAIYGVRGGNGVIVVITKSGKSGKTTFNFDSYYGVQEVTRTIPVLNATEYAAILNEASVNSGGGIIFPDLSGIGKGTNWQREVIKEAPISSYNFSASGGSDTSKYYYSAGFLGQEGVVGGSKSYFDRFNLVANNSIDLTDKIKFILNTNYTNIKGKGLSENNIGSVLSNALNFDPMIAPRDANGNFGISSTITQEIVNPLTQIHNTHNFNNTNKLFGKGELQYEVLENLKVTSRFAYNYVDIYGKWFTPYAFYGVGHNATNANEDLTPIVSVDQTTGEITQTWNRVTESKTNFFNYTFETFVNYDFKIGEDHSFDTVFGFSLFRDKGENISANNVGIPFNSWEFADVASATGDATNQTASSWQYVKRNMSYFGRINYDYKGKYIASAIARYDGSTAFGENNKFGLFPSGSLAWVASKEDFFKSKFIDLLKLKVSYGIVGNENIPNQFSSISTFPKYTFDGTIVTGSALGTIPNQDISWEKQKQFNAGFETYMFDSKLSIIADYYRKDVSDLLFAPDTPPTLGTIPAPLANIGTSKTDGVDISISFNNDIGSDFKYNTSLNFTTVSSKVTQVNNSSKRQFGSGYGIPWTSITVFEEGYSPWYFYGYKTDGIFQNQSEIDAHAVQNGAQPGDIRFKDVNGDGVVDDLDRTHIGNPLPDFTIGWNAGFEYKNFDFSLQTYASVGNDIYRAFERNLNYTNRSALTLNRWKGAGTSTTEPRVTFIDTNNNRRASDRYIEDGSYFRIKNISAGYTLPSTATEKAGLSSVRFYAQVKNALTLTKYSGYDPEITSGSFADTGIDRGTYPIPRIWSVGLNIKF